jgi:hypothetical protein
MMIMDIIGTMTIIIIGMRIMTVILAIEMAVMITVAMITTAILVANERNRDISRTIPGFSVH